MKTLQLLSDPGAWIKNAIARTAKGEMTYATAGDAASWCLLGAMLRCYPDGGGTYMDVRKKVEIAITNLFPERVDPSLPISVFNNHPDTTHADMVKVLREAGV